MSFNNRSTGGERCYGWEESSWHTISSTPGWVAPNQIPNDNPVLPAGWQGSTALDPVIKSYNDLILRSKSFLGYPFQNDELPDTTWAMIVDNACEIYQYWEGSKKEEYLVFCEGIYRKGCGVKLDELVAVACNKNKCSYFTSVQMVTSQRFVYTPIETNSAYLSVTPFVYPYTVNYTDRFQTVQNEFSGTSGQFVNVYFDPKNPWKAKNVCNANFFTIDPLNSEWFKLSANPCLSGTVFDFIDDSSISSLAPIISSSITDGSPLSAVPLLSLGNALSTISPEWFPLSCFYPADINLGPPVQACVNIGQGLGVITPTCGAIDNCSPLTAQYTVSPDWNYSLTSVSITSQCANITALNFADISAYFANYNLINGISLVSSVDLSSNYCFDLQKPVISGFDSSIFDLSALDISKATNARIYNIPSCTDDGSIPLTYNNGIIATFTECNSSFSTSGPMPVDDVQFFIDNKPPAEALTWYSNINNNGFTMYWYNSAYNNCIRSTAAKVPVNVSFYNQTLETSVGMVSTVHKSNFDEGFSKTRKVLGVFSVDPPTGGYYGGSSDLLYNFDYAIMAGAFGYDISSGTRSSMLKQSGYDLVTFHLAKSFTEQARKMLKYTSYTYDPTTQYLKITPEPVGAYSVGSQIGDSSGLLTSAQCYMVGVYLSPTIEEMLSTYWVQEYVLAKAKTIIGTIRSKYGNNKLVDGSTIDGTSMLQEGNERIKELMKELRDDAYYGSPPLWYMG